MTCVTVLYAVLCVAIVTSSSTKPLCELCKNIVNEVDEVLKKGGDVEKAVSEFCRNDVPAFLSEMCEKIIAKNLKYIIEKLKEHDSAEKICTDLYLCNE
ncbi:hypothetical protein KIN20_013468 [Parelaphostrongylus tenuis]|uniref:Saposin B-type domain-containing protein n=1 Tax=Parelaphostrongylus tenuis TaxID=148309 RepID=A0AAD5MFN2_PARTN|nr:hypothetical protein KIN20_013468 [Parelaphostrongylus tenuis]